MSGDCTEGEREQILGELRIWRLVSWGLLGSGIVAGFGMAGLPSRAPDWIRTLAAPLIWLICGIGGFALARLRNRSWTWGFIALLGPLGALWVVAVLNRVCRRCGVEELKSSSQGCRRCQAPL